MHCGSKFGMKLHTSEVSALFKYVFLYAIFAGETTVLWSSRTGNRIGVDPEASTWTISSTKCHEILVETDQIARSSSETCLIFTAPIHKKHKKGENHGGQNLCKFGSIEGA